MAPLPGGPPTVVRERQHHRRAHGLYFHSSPPKVLPMNNYLAPKDNDGRGRDVIKPSNIRIWLHHKQMSKLAKVLWAGQGMRLRTETSHHPRMKRFLECVPHVMGVIKEIHQAVVDNDLDTLKEKTDPPAPRVILTSKDANGLTPLHKAAGLAHTQIVEYILSVWPSLSSDEDHTGKTPLHWAASAKNNARSFNLLVQAGADETSQDDRHRVAEYYKNKPSEIDRSMLSVIPEAPRISQQGFPAYFDWGMFTLEDDSDEGSTQTRMKPFLSQNNLLDAADASPGAAGPAGGGDVVKSKSVHNLTNGVLTELGTATERPAKETDDSTGAKENGKETEVDDTAADQQEEGQDAENEMTEPTVEQDETVVEQDEPGKGSAPIVGHTFVAPEPPENAQDETGDGGQEMEQEKPETESELVRDEDSGEPSVQAVGDEQKVDAADEEGSVGSRGASSKATSMSASAKSTARDDPGTPPGEQEVEPNEENTSPVAGEDAEVSKDSLESAAIGRKDDEIEQDSLGKDLEPEEVPKGLSAGPTRSPSAKSVRESTNAESPARTNTAKSVRSTSEHEPADPVEQMSRPVSAIIDQNGQQSNPDGLENGTNGQETPLDHAEDQQDSTSVKSGRQSGQSGKVSSANEPATSDSRPQSRADSNGALTSRLASTPTAAGRLGTSSGKSITSTATTNRRASIGSRKSLRSTTGGGVSAKGEKGDLESADESDANDDSNNADVQIVRYRTPDEKVRRTPRTTVESASVAGDGDIAEVPEVTQPQEQQQDTAEVQDPVEHSTAGSVEDRRPLEINATEASTRTVEPPNQVLEIEGTVQGEPDHGQLQSQNRQQIDLAEQPNMLQTAQDAIDSADLEQLAAIVLNGQGKQLIGKASEQTEIQAFLDNVPAYMGKIRRVHLAAREGSLRDLQSALDRRKFATAKDEISPHGATPLHVATIFGHAGIVRYLAGRFPETLSATDDDGRTPLHYAATLKDNGHFYNLLTHLGANPKVEDNLNNSAEYYLGHVQSQGILSHRQLLRDYGAKEELADEMLNDQELGEQQMEIPLFRTEEGRYLATSLGDPLIKGLTEIANKRPSDPVTYLANYLYNFANQKSKTGRREGDNDSNNNMIQGTVSQTPEKDLESSSRQAVPISNALSQPPPMEPHVKDEQQSSPDDSDIVPTPSDDRDEHGQSILHFACARSHGRNALIQLIEESGTNITYRDELYRTARDVALQATQPDNAKEIDRYVIGLVARGDVEALNGMLLEGYDHLVDVVAPDGVPILQVASDRGFQEIVRFLEGVRAFEENRENLLTAIRQKQFESVVNLTKQPDGAKLVRAKNYYGRCSLHIAILMENEDIVDYLASNFKAALKIGDNLDRTPLHYAMGVSNVEALSRILIKNGAKRVLKDLKGRQPSYYFMNKADILRLQEEEKE